MDSRNRSAFIPFACLIAAAYLLLPAAVQDDGRPIAWWVWLLIILVLLVIAIWLWSSRRETKAPPPAETRTQSLPVEQTVTTVEAREDMIETPADDLKIIEGIGPKIASVLNNAGIMTFNQLADADPAILLKILQDANLRLADPTSWRDQARLAAAGDMDGLKRLQDSLTAGRVD